MLQVKKNEEAVRNDLKNRQRLTLPAKDVALFGVTTILLEIIFS